MSQKVVVLPYERYLTLKQLAFKNSSKVEEELVDNFVNSGKVGGELVDSLPGNQILTHEIYDSVEDDNLLSVEDIIEYIPKTYRHRARLILHHMKHNLIKWDSFGRLVVGEDCLIDSHIVDLIRDVIGSYKRRCCSVHSNTFKKLLIATHCPKSILNKTDDETK